MIVSFLVRHSRQNLHPKQSNKISSFTQSVHNNRLTHSHCLTAFQTFKAASTNNATQSKEARSRSNYAPSTPPSPPNSPISPHPDSRTLRSSSRKLLRPALLLGPVLLVVRLGVDLQLLYVCVDDFLAAVGALVCLALSLVLLPLVIRRRRREGWNGLWAIGMGMDRLELFQGRTRDVGLGALTGRPLALTGARVPAASAFLWSRWTCDKRLAGCKF
jgi:hypothetical protein